jgi:hypothetical protein
MAGIDEAFFRATGRCFEMAPPLQMAVRRVDVLTNEATSVNAARIIVCGAAHHATTSGNWINTALQHASSSKPGGTWLHARCGRT